MNGHTARVANLRCRWCGKRLKDSGYGQVPSFCVNNKRRCYFLWRYHSLPGEKERVKTNSYRWIAKIRRTNPKAWERFRARNNEARKRYYQRQKRLMVTARVKEG